MKLESSAFVGGEVIPSRYTCDGENISPDLMWSGVPDNARSLALIVDDPDAPDPAAPKMTWVHWVLYNLPVELSRLTEGAGDLASGIGQGLNDWQRIGYGGPCPPIGRHRYFFKLYALDTTLSFTETPTKAQLEAAMETHIVAVATLMGTYQRDHN